MRFSARRIGVPCDLETLMPILTVLPHELFAYHLAVPCGCDVGRRRNPAKRVAVG